MNKLLMTVIPKIKIIPTQSININVQPASRSVEQKAEKVAETAVRKTKRYSRKLLNQAEKPDVFVSEVSTVQAQSKKAVKVKKVKKQSGAPGAKDALMDYFEGTQKPADMKKRKLNWQKRLNDKLKKQIKAKDQKHFAELDKLYGDYAGMKCVDAMVNLEERCLDEINELSEKIGFPHKAKRITAMIPW